MNLLAELRQRFAAALESLEPGTVELAEMVLPSKDAKHGDYQANCAMPLGKRLKQPPREIAQQLVDRLEVSDLCEPPEIAGPGFINLRIQDTWLTEQLQATLSDKSQLGVTPVAEPRTFVLDYSSPNVAKPMHVGHIRSTVIGAALYRVLKQLGHRVISDNHIGDWGTQFGMIIYGYKHFVDEAALAEAMVPELSRLYKLVSQLVDYHATRSQKIPDIEQKINEVVARLEEMHDATELEHDKDRKKAAKKLRQAEGQLVDLRKTLDSLRRTVAVVDDDPALAALAAEHSKIGAAVLAETAALHVGDATNKALWDRFLPACLAEIDATYERLGVTFDHALGESFYHDRLAGVVEDLTARELVEESDGAKCVFLDGHQAPFIVQKQDGAFLYATTDLATVQYRLEEWKPDAIIYVVDHRQSLHFEQLFATLRLWARDGMKEIELQHVSFGTVLGEDGKPYKTRSGSAVGLTGLLDEAVERAHKIVCENDDARDESYGGPFLSADERQQVAQRIGIGAIKYADLAHNRTSDYVFSYDKMLAMNGNTATYMQYSYARVRSIFGKGDVDLVALRTGGASLRLEEVQERALGLALVQFSEALSRVAADYRPNHLTTYLFDLASKYSSFFENCPVLKAEDDVTRDSRLLLCDLTARTLARGLELLGIETVERM
ncbi:MAG: arginine--tRNA ligase [Planctomycetes bacterium]|nr:arginine--tRNA ligase [Planctomycetota bacterium]